MLFHLISKKNQLSDKFYSPNVNSESDGWLYQKIILWDNHTQRKRIDWMDGAHVVEMYTNVYDYNVLVFAIRYCLRVLNTRTEYMERCSGSALVLLILSSKICF